MLRKKLLHLARKHGDITVKSAEDSKRKREIEKRIEDLNKLIRNIRRLKSYAVADTLTRKMVLDLLKYVTIDKYVDRHSHRNIHIYYKLIDKPLNDKNNALA